MRGTTFYGTDLSVTTGVGTTCYRRPTGIRARNYGTGALTVTANGDVTGHQLGRHLCAAISRLAPLST